MKPLFWGTLGVMLLIGAPLTSSHAGTGAEGKTVASLSESAASTSTRYGFLDMFDHLSNYGEEVFPEPFLVDDTDLEVNEARLDWLHTQGPGQQSDTVTGEIEKGFGPLTLEVEAPYQWERADGEFTQGWGNIDLGARVPFFEYVSGNGFVNTTFGTAIEVGIPTMSEVSQNTELVPKLFNDLTLGEHFTLQSIFGYSMLFGKGDDAGLQTFEYGFVFGYTFQHKELPIPGVQQFIPMFELIGEKEINGDDPGDGLTADVGFRVNLTAIGPVQPRLGCAFVFPINQRASEEVHGGIVTSLVFEY